MQFALEYATLCETFFFFFLISNLAFECSDLDGVFSFAFVVMCTTFSDKNQNFEIFGQKTCFLSKIQRFLELPHFIPEVVIIIEKYSIFPKMYP